MPVLNNNNQVSVLMSSFYSLIHSSTFGTLCALETSMNCIIWATSVSDGCCQEVSAQDKEEVKVFIMAPADTA